MFQNRLQCISQYNHQTMMIFTTICILFLIRYFCCIVHCVVINNEEHVCISKYKIIFLFSVMKLAWSREQSQRVRAHGGAVGRRTSQWTTDLSRNSGTYIVYISLLCFSLVMLSASHWLLAQARFCGRTHLPLSPNSTTPTIRWFSDIFDRMHLFST